MIIKQSLVTIIDKLLGKNGISHIKGSKDLSIAQAKLANRTA